MFRRPPRSGAHRASRDPPTLVQNLKTLVKENTPTRVMGLKLGRTEDSVRAKAQDENVSLKPVNQSTYNRQKPK